MVILEEETYKKFGYHSNELKPKSNKKIITACDNCGKIRETTKSYYYALCRSCSKKGSKCHLWKGGRVKQVCEVCGKSFLIDRSEIKKGWGKYCSRKCMGLAQSKERRGKYSSNWKGGKIERKCEECGKLFLIPQAWIKKGGGRFCSQKCKDLFQSGENSPAWKGGVSFEPYCYKFNNEFKEYIRAKFGNVCFLCGKTEEANRRKLSVHHVNYDKGCGCAETEKDRKADDDTCQFVPLCISCNSKANKDRDKWERYFKTKLRNKLNGWYI